MQKIEFHSEGTTLYVFQDFKIIECEVEDVTFNKNKDGFRYPVYRLKKGDHTFAFSKTSEEVFKSKEALKEKILSLF